MQIQEKVQELFSAGVHFGFGRSRRHPSARKFIFGTKNHSDIINLEETHRCLENAKEFLATLASQGKQVLFVGGKHEASKHVRDAAVKAGQPYVHGRFIGGTLTNFVQIRKRVERMLRLTKERESGDLDKYTKKERLMISREIEELEGRFGGIADMASLPAAVVIVDPRYEHAVAKEAILLKIPVVGVANTDCDFAAIEYPVPANDASVKSLAYILDELATAYRAHYKPVAEQTPTPAAPIN